jgi:hypothetical protein
MIAAPPVNPTQGSGGARSSHFVRTTLQTSLRARLTNPSASPPPPPVSRAGMLVDTMNKEAKSSQGTATHDIELVAL